MGMFSNISDDGRTSTTVSYEDYGKKSIIIHYKRGDRVIWTMNDADKKHGTVLEVQERFADKDNVYLVGWDNGIDSSVSGYWLEALKVEYKSIW